MEFNFEWRRLLLLAALLGGFAILGGFSAPHANEEHSPAQARKAWGYCIVLFVTGAACATVVDHYTGTMSYTNLRPAYILLGVLLMGMGWFWLKILKDEVAKPPPFVGVIVCQVSCPRPQAVPSHLP
jgi:Mn2+/Fe2+ NRAMP family transporter